MNPNTQAWLARADEILAAPRSASETVQAAVSLMTAVYGAQSAQVGTFNTALAQIAKSGVTPQGLQREQAHYAVGAIRNTVAEIRGGLIVNLRAQVAGEVLGELIASAKQTLEDDTEAAKNVSAVLTAAAFEDLMRRMGTELAGMTSRPKLEEVIGILKNGGLLVGGEVATAMGYLKFRNDSLHADWANVRKSQVQSCIGFLEVLLSKHFS